MKGNPILFSHAFNKSGLSHAVENADASRELKNKGLSWVHLDSNLEETKTWLEQEVSYLDHLIIDALTAEETRPRLMEFDGGLLIILREINFNKNAEPEDMVSIRMWIDKQRIITLQRRDMKSLWHLEEKIKSGKKIKNSGEFLYNLIYQIFTTTSAYLYDLGERLDDLESKIMVTHDMKLREEILQIRTQVAAFKRYLMPQKEVIAKLKVADRPWIDEWALRHFQENFDQITHMIEEIDEVRDKSQILNDELSNALTEKLNKSMYKIAVITSIFMPLTFITGLFGMNVGGIPGSNNSAAFDICTFTMLFLVFVHILILKRKDWF